ncbi:MAG: LysR family transcriptional regulator [Pseudomonadota bacterium]
MPRPRIPSLNWLRVFEAAARAESFARAAQALNMSPPAVSQQIKALEAYLGRDLFTRGARQVTLTEAGLAFLPAVAQSLHTVELAAENLFDTPRREPLVVQASQMFGCSWLAPRLAGFRALEPDVQLTLTSGIASEDFLRPGPDLRITFGQPQALSEDGDALFGEILYPVSTPEIATEIRSAHDLARWPLIEIAIHRANWLTLLPPDGPDPQFLYTDTSVNAFALAASGQGIALARAPASDTLQAVYDLVPCLTGLSVGGVQSYALVYPARSALSRAALAFRTWLLAEADGMRGDGRISKPSTATE